MVVETWKVMIALAAGLTVFGIYLAIADVDLGPVDALFTFVLAVLFSAALYVVIRIGYRIGKRAGRKGN